MNIKVNKSKKAIILISGGLDSAVIAAIAKNKGYDLYFLFADYGQKTLKKEKECVKNLEKHFKPKDLVILDLKWLKEIGKSGLFDKDTKLTEDNFRLQYVPFRNTILLSAATAWGETIDADSIFIGSSGSDHVCPDNNPKYLKAFQNIMKEGTMLNKKIKLKAPLVKYEKKYAIELGSRLKVPFQFTWTCHNNEGKLACGECGNCTLRLEAFKDAGKIDPLKYSVVLNK